MKVNGFKVEKYNQYNFPEKVKKYTCPLCSESRKKKTQKCLTLDWERYLANCWHCGETLQINTYRKRETEKKYIRPKWKNKTELSDKVVKFFESRKISQLTLKRLKVSSGNEYMPVINKKCEAIQFNYFINDELINIKYRGPKKTFKMHKGSELVFYNLDSIRNSKECYITEGEIDCLTLIECGIDNVVSVPNGAALRNNNLEYLDNCFQYFENKEKIYLCLDNDEAGKNLEKELIRRLGIEKCYYFDFNSCKDANEYVIKYGKESLRQVIESPIIYPITDVITLEHDEKQLDDYLLNGLAPGYGIGIKEIDEIFTVDLGMVMTVTGIPKYGKSTWIDFITTNYNLKHKWKIGFASPENQPVYIHKERIISKMLGYEPKGASHNKSKPYKDAKIHLNQNFFFMCFNDGKYELSRVLDKARELILRKGIKVLVIDPFNKVRLEKSLGKNINEYTNDYILELDMFARRYNILIILVAHPKKLGKDATGQREQPDFYDVKGGGEFYDMMPLGVVIHRDWAANMTNFKVLKVKFQHLGTNEADVDLKYNINNGRYSVPDSLTSNCVYDNSNWLTNKEPEVFEDISDLNLDDIEPNKEFDIPF
jgi:twinkle protein